MMNSARFGWTVLLPVKVLARAKSRLAVLAGPLRCELALALASDTVTATLACPEVARVVAITSDPLAGSCLAALGAIIVADIPDAEPGQARPGGPDAGGPGALAGLAAPDDVRGPRGEDALNLALRRGAAQAVRRWPGTGLAALTADLPALRPADLAAALRAATGHLAAFVPDAAGVGTTLYTVAPGGEFLPMFGGASRKRHASAGAFELSLDIEPGLRRDVDTPDDLRAAAALGAGPRTTALAARLLADAHPCEDA